MITLDIDIEEIEKVSNPIIRDIARQLKDNGIAFYTDPKYSNNISRALSNMRHKKVVFMAPDSRLGEYAIALREPKIPIPGIEEQLNKEFKKMLDLFK